MTEISDFVYEYRDLKAGDIVTLKNFKKGDLFGPDQDFEIDARINSLLLKLPTLFYIEEVDTRTKYCKIKTKKTGGKIYDDFYPNELFAIVQVPKSADVLKWLFDNQKIEYPQYWTLFETELTNIARYIPKMFQTNLKIIYLINKHVNHLYKKHSVRDILIFYKTLIHRFHFNYGQRYTVFNQMSKQREFVNTCKEINPMWHTRDALSLWILNNFKVFNRDGSKYISNEEYLDKFNNVNKRVVTKGADFDELNEIVKNLRIQDDNNRFKNDDRFIPELTQEIIDELELTIFNVKSIPHKNQVAIIFIDKYNNKRYCIQDFVFEFYISSNQRIMDNDYIVDYDPKIHMKHIVRDYQHLKTIKFAVNDNHKRFMRNGGFV